MTSLALLLILLFVGLAWLLGWPGRPTDHAEPSADETGDAEGEVRELDASTTPDEADDELRDWGPGAP